MIADTAPLSDAGTLGGNTLHRKLYNQNRPCDEVADCVTTHSPSIYQHSKTLPYPHHFITADDVSETMGDLLTSGFYEWDMRPMRAVGRSPSPHPAILSGQQTSGMAAVERNAEDVVEVLIEDHTTRKKILVCNSDRQNYTREEIWPTTFQACNVENPLRADSQTHEIESKKSLRTSK